MGMSGKTMCGQCIWTSHTGTSIKAKFLKEKKFIVVLNIYTDCRYQHASK